jgi:hypothetical protein
LSGSYNTIDESSPCSTISGGQCNQILTHSDASSINSGFSNTIESIQSSIVGSGNYLASSSSAIGGGALNFVGKGVTKSVIICSTGSQIILAGDQTSLYQSGSNVNIYNEGDCKVYKAAVGGVVLVCGQTIIDVGYSGSCIIPGTNSQILNTSTAAAGNAGTRFSSIGSGYSNMIYNSACFSVISGGADNISGSSCTTISGGRSNSISGDEQAVASVIAGGFANTISCYSNYSVISGGATNTVSTYSYYGVIAGGGANRICDNSNISTISGGYTNVICDNSGFSTISGGYQNTIEPYSNSATLGGGYQNCSKGEASSIGGGKLNRITDVTCGQTFGTTISGGYCNTIANTNSLYTCSAYYSPSFSTIGGGRYNLILSCSSAYDSTISGGCGNLITTCSGYAFRSTISGGYHNTIDSSIDSIIAGGSSNRITGSSQSVIGGGLGNCLIKNSYYSNIGGGVSNTIDNNSCYSSISGGCANTIVTSSFASAGGWLTYAHVQGQRVYSGQNTEGCAGQFQQHTQWTAANALGATGCVGLYVDANNTNFKTLTGSVISGILNISSFRPGSCSACDKTSQFIRQFIVKNTGSAVLVDCRTIGTDYTSSGYFSAPTIDIVNTNEIRIQACNPSGTKTMAYFSGIEMKG